MPWLDDAYVERIVHGLSGRVEVSATHRECYHPLCDVPVHRYQLDHIVEYSTGGETTQDNGNPLRVPQPPAQLHQVAERFCSGAVRDQSGGWSCFTSNSRTSGVTASAMTRISSSDQFAVGMCG